MTNERAKEIDRMTLLQFEQLTKREQRAYFKHPMPIEQRGRLVRQMAERVFANPVVVH